MKKLRSLACLSAFLGITTVASTNALAFEEFTIDETNLTSGAYNNIVADKLVGPYFEVAKFGAGNTFDTYLLWTIESYTNTNAPGAIPNDLNDEYQLYALFDGSGTFAPTVDGFAFTFSSGTLNLYLDTGFDTTFNASNGAFTSSADYINTNLTADLTLGTATLYKGNGELDSSCNTTINCGKFGVDSFFSISLDGEQFFVDPSPFYDLAFASGQFNNFDPTSADPQLINGSMDGTFGRVPEPGTLAIFGLGLLGIARAYRRKA